MTASGTKTSTMQASRGLAEPGLIASSVFIEIAVEEVWQAVQQLFEEVILPQKLVQRNGDREKAGVPR